MFENREVLKMLKLQVTVAGEGKFEGTPNLSLHL